MRAAVSQGATKPTSSPRLLTGSGKKQRKPRAKTEDAIDPGVWTAEAPDVAKDIQLVIIKFKRATESPNLRHIFLRPREDPQECL